MLSLMSNKSAWLAAFYRPRAAWAIAMNWMQLWPVVLYCRRRQNAHNSSRDHAGAVPKISSRYIRILLEQSGLQAWVEACLRPAGQSRSGLRRQRQRD